MGSKKSHHGFLKNDERGSALVLVLVMITIMIIVSSIALRVRFLHHKSILKYVHERQALYLAEAGIYKTLWCLSGKDERDMTWRPENERIELEDGYSAFVSVTEWGGYLSIVSEARFKRANKKLRVLIGERPSQDYQNAVVIGSVEYPLVVTGKNRIIGDVVVGKKGIEAGWIRGRGFQGDTLVEGEIKRVDNPEMPYFNETLFKNTIGRYRGLLSRDSTCSIEYASGVLFEDFFEKYRGNQVLVIGDVIIDDLGRYQPWDGEIHIGCTGNLLVHGMSRLKGRIEFFAGGSIRIEGFTEIDGCILFSERGIECGDRTVVTGQLLSPGNIMLKDDCRLEYPSVMYCCGRMTEDAIEGQIVMKGQSVVKGAVILCQSEAVLDTIPDETKVIVSTFSKIIGSLYSKYSTEFSGTVFGNIATGRFRMFDPPTTYINWLRDTTIDMTERPACYLMPLYFDETPVLDIIEWEEVRT